MHADRDDAGEPVALRYTFGFHGDRLWLAGHQLVHTIAPLSAPLLDLSAHSGFWCELRDAAGQPLHRQRLRDPRHPTDEVPGQLRHVPHAEPTGTFTVLTPVLATAATLALVQRRSADPAPRDVLAVPVPA